MMTAPESQSEGGQHPSGQHFDMEGLVGYILLSGVLLSIALILAGLVWHLAVFGNLTVTHLVKGANLLYFLTATLHLGSMRSARPDMLVNLGLVTLMLTPFIRVLGSVLYFALAEHNWKYTLFTAFVLGILTHSLFFR